MGWNDSSMPDNKYLMSVKAKRLESLGCNLDSPQGVILAHEINACGVDGHLLLKFGYENVYSLYVSTKVGT